MTPQERCFSGSVSQECSHSIFSTEKPELCPDPLQTLKRVACVQNEIKEILYSGKCDLSIISYEQRKCIQNFIPIHRLEWNL